MDEIKVEKNIPIPKFRSGYPWDEMEVGDSFYVPTDSVGSARAAATNRARRGNEKYASRTLEGGCRIWRIE